MKFKVLSICILILSAFASCEKAIEISQFDLESNEIFMQTGELKDIKITKFYPAEPKNYEIEITSDNPEVVTIEDGKLKAVQLGEARVDVQVDNVITSCIVKVTSINDEKNDIYLAGSGLENSAMYVKNGVTFALEGSGNQSQATAIDAIGDEVYVSGVIRIRNEDKTSNEAVIWKNGAKTFTIEGNNYLSDLAVTENDLIAVGYELTGSYYNYAFVWKNGDKKRLTEDYSNSVANAVATNGDDIYTAGYYAEAYKVMDKKAVYWKNETVNILPSNGVANANDVAVSGNNVYVCGFDTKNGISVATLWKNGFATSLIDGKNISVATSISVDGDDVYIGGYEQISENLFVPVLWKNGEKQIISEGNLHGYKVLTCASKGDLYVSANMFYEPDIQLKNNKPIVLFQQPFYSIEAIKIIPKQ